MRDVCEYPQRILIQWLLTRADTEGRGKAFIHPHPPRPVVRGWGEVSSEGRQAAQRRCYNEAHQTAGLTALAGDAWGPC